MIKNARWWSQDGDLEMLMPRWWSQGCGLKMWYSPRLQIDILNLVCFKMIELVLHTSDFVKSNNHRRGEHHNLLSLSSSWAHQRVVSRWAVLQSRSHQTLSRRKGNIKPIEAKITSCGEPQAASSEWIFPKLGQEKQEKAQRSKEKAQRGQERPGESPERQGGASNASGVLTH